MRYPSGRTAFTAAVLALQVAMGRAGAALLLALMLACCMHGTLASCNKRKAVVPESERFFNHQPLTALPYEQLPANFSWKDKDGVNWLAPSWNQHIVSGRASQPVRLQPCMARACTYLPSPYLSRRSFYNSHFARGAVAASILWQLLAPRQPVYDPRPAQDCEEWNRPRRDAVQADNPELCPLPRVSLAGCM
jgi:hypothetical protein